MILLASDYTFNAAAKTITFLGSYAAIERSQIKIIANSTDNVIIYQFNKSSLGGTYAAPVLTLTYNTTAMSNGDSLMIIVDVTGQKTMASSEPVVIASDQSAIPVSGTVAITGVATAANQATQITAEQAIQATAGATTGVAVITDSDGTIQQYLRGLVKLFITAGSALVTATLAAGSAIIGKVGIDQTTDGTTNKVRATGTYKPSYGSNTAMTVTSLHSLGNSATAGWQSDRVSNLSTLATDYAVNVKIAAVNTSPANDKSVYVYICAWYTSDGGSTWYASSGGTTTLPGGTEGTYTIASPNNLRLAGVLNYTTQNGILQDTFNLKNMFPTMPDGFSIVIINYTGFITAASGNIVQYKPLNDTIV